MTLIALGVGVFIGWIFPQPEIAKKATDWVKDKFSSVFK